MFEKIYRMKYLKLLLFILILSPVSSYAVETEIFGIVRDSSTRETLPYVSIYFKNTTRGTITDIYGKYTIITEEPGVLVFSMMGYKEYKVNIKADGIRRNIKVNLIPETYSLNEIIVNPKRQRYKNKNNPAVDLVKEMIEHKEMASPRNHDFCTYDQYQKITYAWNEFEERKHTLLSKKFGFLYDHTDTSRYGKSILPVGLRECISTRYFLKEREKERTLIRAEKNVGIDEIFPQEGVKRTINEMFKEVDIFRNDIELLTNHFVSPLANIAPSFYKYFILDTLVVNGDSCVNLAFTPRTTEAYGFTGNLYVSLDTSRFIHHAHFNIPKDINLNFVESMYFEQDFSRAPDGTRLINRDFVCVEFFAPALPRVYGERLNTYQNYDFAPIQDMTIFEQPATEVEASGAGEVSTAAWDTLRHETLQPEEQRMDSLMAQLKSVKVFRAVHSILDVCVNNYIPTKKENSQFDYGPFFSTISTNRLEGFRVRLGGETTTAFDKHFFLNTYIAYGFKDKLPKGMGMLEYSFNDKKKYRFEYPIHSIQIFGKYDIGKVGESFVGYDNILASLFSRTDDRNAIYQKEAGVTYQNEFYSGFSYVFRFLHKTSYSTWLTAFNRYNEDGTYTSIDDYTMNTFKLSFRYCPSEKFYESRRNRFNLNKERPEFILSHSFGIKGFLGTDYTYNRTEASFQKRCWLSYFGYVDLFFKASKVWNDVPYTLLDVPDVSCSDTIKEQAFSLMDPVEFVCNQSLTWDIAYYLNGLILNRVPVLRKLQLREFVTFKGVYAKLSDESNPMRAQHLDGLFVFPSTSYSFDRLPYMEAGVGLDNVLKLFKFEYIWRLTYRDHVDVPRHGLRFALHVDF